MLNNLPPATNPALVYKTKRHMIINEVSRLSATPWRGKRSASRLGMVKARVAILALRRRVATNVQFIQVPIAKPTAVQIASCGSRAARPGKPNSTPPLISLAPALNPPVVDERDRPPRRYCSMFFVFFHATKPIQMVVTT